jgi:AcrR family transcriptional regulator
MTSASVATARRAKADRGDQTRERLLTASVGVFGRHGFDGATTRMLAEAAGVNQQAIPYHFGSKEGLHIATADFIVEQIGTHVGPMRESLNERFRHAQESGDPVDATQARALLTQMIETVATMFAGETSEPWARFIIREQMEPTEAFQRLYDGIMGPMFGVAARLLGILLREDPDSERVRLRTMSLLGSVLVFRVAHAAVLARLEWASVGPAQLAIIQAHARDLVAAI